jgi:hypothetical protein
VRCAASIARAARGSSGDSPRAAAAAVIADPQPHQAVAALDADPDVACGRVCACVSDRFLGGAEYKLLDLAGQRQIALHVHADLDASRCQRRHQVGQRRRQALVAQRRRVDLQQQ